MKANKYIIALAIGSATIFSSCTDWLDQEPLSNVTTGSYFKKAADFESAANSLYAQLPGYNTNVNYTIYDNGTDLNYLGKAELSANIGASTSDSYYSAAYKQLRQVNNLLEKAQEYGGNDDISASVGTAYFFRAFWHFYLLQRFGGITLALEVL